MKAFIRSLLVIFMTLISLRSGLKAQETIDTTQLWHITMFNDNEYTGYILDRNPEVIVLKTAELGTINLKVIGITKMEPITEDRIINGQYWFDNPQATRYFFSPAGHGLRKGEGYYQNAWLFFNQVSFGLTDYFSLGGGTVPLFLFAGAPTPVWITPKFSIPIGEKLHIGAGALAGIVLGADNNQFGTIYGTTTFGSRDKNLSVGLGYGFTDGALAEYPTINLSGMIRFGKRGYFITENYFIGTANDATLIISAGGRRVGKKITLDYGGIIPFTEGTLIALPWLGISVPIGKKYE